MPATPNVQKGNRDGLHCGGGVLVLSPADMFASLSRMLEACRDTDNRRVGGVEIDQGIGCGLLFDSATGVSLRHAIRLCVKRISVLREIEY